MSFQQQVGPWEFDRLGLSGLTMAQDGCFVTAVAQVMALCGWPVDPGIVCERLNATGGFTPDGLAVWAKITAAFPQFVFGGSGFHVVQGYSQSLKSYHWWAQDGNGTVYDPWTGTGSHPAGFLPTGYAIGVSCAQAPVSVVVQAVADTASSDFQVHFDATLRVRQAPTANSPVMAQYAPGTVVECVGRVTGEPINGNPWWYKSKLHGWYFTAEYSHLVSNVTPQSL